MCAYFYLGMQKNKVRQGLDVYKLTITASIEVPFFDCRISAGFPSPDDDYITGKIDLNKQLIKNPEYTFYVRVAGDSMIDAGINDGDILIVERSITLKNNMIIIAVIDGELTVKRFLKRRGKVTLIAENPDYNDIDISHQELSTWGVVTYIIHKA